MTSPFTPPFLSLPTVRAPPQRCSNLLSRFL